VAEFLRLVVWTPGERFAEVLDVRWVHVELVGGKGLTIWPAHAPLLAETLPDTVRYEDAAGGRHMLDLPPGVLHVRDNVVSLFLAGTIDEQAWEHPESGTGALERLAGVLLAESSF